MVLVDSGCLENGDQDLIFIRANTASNSDIQRTCIMLQANLELKFKEIRKKILIGKMLTGKIIEIKTFMKIIQVSRISQFHN